jgi:hypothetical protein
MRAASAAGVLGLLMLQGLAIPVSAASSRAVVSSNRFSSSQPSASTGRVFTVSWSNPDDPAGKPKPLDHFVLTLAPGAVFDTSALPPCTASDPQLMLSGASACPPESTVGIDEAVIDTGGPGPTRYFTVEFVAFNNVNELILVGHDPNTGATVSVVRGAIKGGTLTVTSPFIPGSPPDGGAEKSETATFYDRSTAVGGQTLNYLTTPPLCPASHTWTNTVVYYYKDGTVETLTNTSPCSTGTSGGSTKARSAATPAVADNGALPVTGTTPPFVGAGALLLGTIGISILRRLLRELGAI